MRIKYLFLLVFLMGCIKLDDKPGTSSGKFLDIYEDTEHGVVCYIGYKTMSCVNMKVK